MITESPYLSVIVCTRNDDHGGSIKKRTETFLDCLVQQLKKYRIESELIIVEWNPPIDRPPLKEALKWPDGGEWCDIRIITVPPEVHKKFRHSSGLPLFQMIAKNVGMRASRGKFVLMTNVDILFSDTLMEFIGLRKLEEGKFYRVDRYDVPSEVLGDTLDEKLAFCQNNTLHVTRKNGSYDLATGKLEECVYYEDRTRYSDVSPKIRGFCQTLLLIPITRLTRSDYGGSYSTSQNGIQNSPNGLFSYFISAAIRLDNFVKPRMLSPEQKLKTFFSTPPVRLYTNACGDFTLMSRMDWMRTGGYAELEMYSLHIDSLLLYSAYYAGIREEYLSAPIYHMDHTLGWTRRDTLLRELSHNSVPHLRYEDFLSIVAVMSMSNETRLNKDNWGLSDISLRESCVYLTHEELEPIVK